MTPKCRFNRLQGAVSDGETTIDGDYFGGRRTDWKGWRCSNERSANFGQHHRNDSCSAGQAGSSLNRLRPALTIAGRWHDSTQLPGCLDKTGILRVALGICFGVCRVMCATQYCEGTALPQVFLLSVRGARVRRKFRVAYFEVSLGLAQSCDFGAKWLLERDGFAGELCAT